MERITYLLGAGFSAPLGVPVMNNFLEKAKDIYSADPEQFQHFLEVFDTIRQMSVCKNYYTTDLFNIEEILSILEMNVELGNRRVKSFERFIIDVINYYTPPIEAPVRLAARWHEHIFGASTLWNIYGSFIGSLFNLEFSDIRQKEHGLPTIKVACTKKRNTNQEYSIITLNYDLVLENVCRFINQNYEIESEIGFRKGLDLEDENQSDSPTLTKMHGSIDSGNIIPPTWNKSLNRTDVMKSWKLAYQLLVQTNHIRIIGYSLPETDTYVKYLLRAAVIHCPHLKSIDVLCLDYDSSVRKRFDEFILFKNYKFISGDVRDYLECHLTSCKRSRSRPNEPSQVRFDCPEEAHANFFKERTQ